MTNNDRALQVVDGLLPDFAAASTSLHDQLVQNIASALTAAESRGATNTFFQAVAQNQVLNQQVTNLQATVASLTQSNTDALARATTAEASLAQMGNVMQSLQALRQQVIKLGGIPSI